MMEEQTMKYGKVARLDIKNIALVVIVAGLLLWLLQPVSTPPSAQLRGAASVAGFLLLIAAGAGLAAMATVQFWKVLFQPRAAFHAIELESIFGESTDQVFGLAAPIQKGDNLPRPGESEALNHLLDNPTEVVMGQLRSVADYILLRPEGYERALRRLAGDAGAGAIEKYLMQRQESQPTNRERESTSRDTGPAKDALVEVRFFVEQRLNLVHV